MSKKLSDEQVEKLKSKVSGKGFSGYSIVIAQFLFLVLGAFTDYPLWVYLIPTIMVLISFFMFLVVAIFVWYKYN